MVIDARTRLSRVRLHEPARLVLARRRSGEVDRTADSAEITHVEDRSADAAVTVANAARRLAGAIATDPSVERDVATVGHDALADQLVPIVAWAFDVPDMTDVDAVRIGVTVARTRLLLGTPRSIVLAAVHGLPAVLGDSTSPRRLDEIAIEVALRLRRRRDSSGELPAS